MLRSTTLKPELPEFLTSWRINLRNLLQQAKRKAYLALVYPHLVYSVPVWTPHQRKGMETFAKVQNRAV